MAADSSTQRITHLTALGAILALVEARVGALPPQRAPLAGVLGKVLAEDIVRHLPPAPLALRDGYAVDAAAVADAGSYSPVPLPSAARRIDVGEPMPSGADAVLPLDAVAVHAGVAVAATAVTAGEGVLAAGADARPSTPLCAAGKYLRAVDVAVLRAAGIESVTVRAPRVRLACGAARDTPVIESARMMLVRAVADAGGTVACQASMLQEALDDDEADFVIAIGGTGSGKADNAVRTLAEQGRIEAHGIAVSPGETTAFGWIGARPVLLLPGRIDAALAVWLLLGRHIAAKLAGGTVEETTALMPLKRKVTSTIGLAELMPVTTSGGMAETLASGYLSLESLSHSDGWIVVPADSEGFAAGMPVAVRSWP